MTRADPKEAARIETPAQWLDELGAALHMPFERAEAIREELAEHLRERIRDLELEGLDESAASSAAVKELGDAAAVARRFRHAERTPIRRRLMNLAVIGLAGAALVTSVVAINGGGQPERPGRAMVYEGQTNVDARPSIAVKPLKVEKGKLGEVLNKLGAEAAARTVVRWNALNECGMDGGDEVNFDAPMGDLASTVAAINEARGLNVNDVGALDYRVKDGVIEFAPRGLFDRRETVLVCYDIGDLIDSSIDLEQMCSVITSFVDPEAWRDNGGDLGSMQLVGRRMFVKAPPRMQDGVKWIMEQLAENQGAASVDAPDAAAAAAVPVEKNNLVYVSGLVQRPGPYNHPGQELTLRRVLIAASINPEAAEARIVRGPADQPEVVGQLRGAELFDPTGADFAIKPGDIVTVK